MNGRASRRDRLYTFEPSSGTTHKAWITSLRIRAGSQAGDFLYAVCTPYASSCWKHGSYPRADAASLKLLTFLLSAEDIGHFLVIGAYRDNEVDAAHPLMTILRDLRRDESCVE